jgi:hypothetical protein
MSRHVEPAADVDEELAAAATPMAARRTVV